MGQSQTGKERGKPERVREREEARECRKKRQLLPHVADSGIILKRLSWFDVVGVVAVVVVASVS